MSRFRKTIGLRFPAGAMLAASILFWGGAGWSAQNKTSTPIGGNGSSPPLTGNTAPSRPSRGGTPLSAPRISVTDLDYTLSKMGGEKQQLSFLPPLDEKELVKAVKHHKKHLSKVLRSVEARGLAFDLTPRIKAELQKAGADENFLAGLKGYTPSARASVSADALVAESGATPEEARAYNQLISRKDSDKRIQDANAFARKFPKSTLLSYIYALQAVAYWEKDAPLDVLASGEKSLALNPHNLTALLLVSSVLPQPQMLRNISYAEKEKRLNLAETYAKKALQELDRLGKGEMAGGVYASLGTVHLERSRLAGRQLDMEELSKAEQSYKTAIGKSDASQSAADFFRLGEVYSMQNKVDEAISAFSHAKRLAPGSIIEQRADRDIQRLQQRQAQAKAY